MIRRYSPILRTSAAASAAFIGWTARDWGEAARAPAAVLAFFFLSGLLYVQVFEYLMHRYAMHRGLPLLRHVRRNHVEHHRISHGPDFRTGNAAHLAHIPGRWWIFPVLFSLHYAVVGGLLPLAPATAFLAACFLHYQAFELSHWFTHLDGNLFDQAVARIPVLGAIRAHQIEHHRVHHDTPSVAFNFTPPYAGDLIAGRMPAPAPAESTVRRPLLPALPAPAPLLSPRRRIVLRPILLYGTALLLGAAALGVAVLAHAKSSPGTSAPPSKT